MGLEMIINIDLKNIFVLGVKQHISKGEEYIMRGGINLWDYSIY